MNIFISNLSYGINDDDLRQAFEGYGEVSSAKVITDKYTGRSRGFGFVEMSDENGQKAIEELNGATFDNKVISVNIARPKENRSDSNNRGGFRGQRDRNSYSNNRY